MRAEELMDFPLFEGLDPEQLELLAPLFRRLTFRPGEHVFAQGDGARDVYVLESGEVAIRFFPVDGGSLDVETILPGGVFGWSAALGRPSYTSSAVCLTPVRAIAARGSELRRVMVSDPQLNVQLLERMVQVVAHRLDCFRAQLIRLLNAEVEDR